MFHLTVRVAWHDSRWNGRVCSAPSCNSFCVALDRIREGRDEVREDALAGRPWSELHPDELPPCRAESGALMSPKAWTRVLEHPYAKGNKTAATHGHLKPTAVKVSRYRTFVVPFAWMLRNEQDAIDAKLPEPLPPDEEPPFPSAWVFGRARQEALVDYWPNQFGNGRAPLELAYALTVHKAQGSEFRKVFVVLPKNCRLLTRELLYTALTRSREKLLLLIEGSDASVLFDFTRPEKSETARRNTNLFQGVVRMDDDAVPYAEHLSHRTSRGHLVRSKSELVIANILYELDVEYDYERVYDGQDEPARVRPDFSFVTPDGDLVIWEHLGMLNHEDYRRGWEWKQKFYERNGFVLGKTLFTSEEGERDERFALRADGGSRSPRPEKRWNARVSRHRRTRSWDARGHSELCARARALGRLI